MTSYDEELAKQLSKEFYLLDSQFHGIYDIHQQAAELAKLEMSLKSSHMMQKMYVFEDRQKEAMAWHTARERAKK